MNWDPFTDIECMKAFCEANSNEYEEFAYRYQEDQIYVEADKANDIKEGN